MINRIELILKTQNLTPTQFADAIGIQRSSMSHILARRNNPSLDFVTKVLNRFPEINAEWLLTGKNQMLSIGTSHPTPPTVQTPQTIIQTPEFEWDNAGSSTEFIRSEVEGLDRKSMPTVTVAEPQKISPTLPVQTSVDHEKIPPASKRDLSQNSDIERIIVFFTDGTFKSYV
jgi:transcriptional regulator with XRE-family HTH domain